MWFRQLFGFDEMGWSDTRNRFAVEGETLRSLANGRRFGIGRFDTPSLKMLREAASQAPRGTLRWTHEVIGDVLELHARPENAGAMFQVASQSNCLEFPHPDATPEDGVTGYARDSTQGPACALAVAPAAAYRTYLVPCRGGLGQERDRQLDNLEGLAQRLGEPLFAVRNGYTHADTAQLRRLAGVVATQDRERLLEHVRIGVQSGADVAFASRWRQVDRQQRVSQAFCSAVSMSYVRGVEVGLWEPLATMVLDAAYEATLCAAARDLALGRGSGRVWLTFLGGGAFGNPPAWIARAIRRALHACADLPLDVRVAHYGGLNQDMVAWVDGASPEK
jgi:hypothetical protein